MALVVFYILGALTLLGGLGVVVTRNVVYGALFLLLALAGVAGLFVLLYAEFLALVQVLIYGGAIIIVILFALMLTRTTEYSIATEHKRWPFAALASAGFFVLMAAAAIGDSERYNQRGREGIGIVELGTSLFEQWAVPFEIASVLLLVALIGAIIIGRSGDGEESER